MNRHTLLGVGAVAFFVGCGPAVYFEREPGHPIAPASRWAWSQPDDDGLRFDDGAIEPTEATARLIAAAIENGLAARGFRRVNADSADFFVHFHVGRHIASDTLPTRRPGDGHIVNPGDGSWGGYGRPETIEERTVSWEEGMLIVDALTAQDGRVAWRGVIVGDIKRGVEADPGPAIRDAVARLLRGFP